MGTGSHAPRGTIDRAVLQAIERRLRTVAFVDRTDLGPTHGTMTLTATIDLAYLPAGVETAYFDIQWYTSDDFSIHYQEVWTDDDRQRRWDRHPYDPPSLEEHFHPPPNADDPVPKAYPSVHFDVLSDVLDATLDHLRTHPLNTRSGSS
jgi:hypothetical protein